jgi:PhzF family phenazine biosynthesis protein
MRQWTVDAFADRSFLGNPACVVEPFEDWPDDAWMQSLARENNQSETAFLKAGKSGSGFDLRWFTPTMEVDLCGHATLAAAHVLFDELEADAHELVFQTRSGPLTVRREDDRYIMDFPSDSPRQIGDLDALTHALGVRPEEVWTGRYLVAVLASEAEVRAVSPDMTALAQLKGYSVEPGQVVVCARSDAAAFDGVDRFFAPGCGIEEDPATGSAHCILAPLFSEKFGRSALRFHQLYPGRGGVIETQLAGDRVLLKGRAVTVMESRLRPAACPGAEKPSP